MPLKVNDIINETKAMISEKLAQAEAEKQALAGVDPSTIPGSENDGANTYDATPDPEVNDTNWTPKGEHNMEGAGDDSAMTRGHASEVDEPCCEPAKKPMESADANAKTAEQANDLLAKIRDFKAASAAVEKVATSCHCESEEAREKCEEACDAKEALHGDQDELDADGDGKIEASDLEELREDAADEKEESDEDTGEKESGSCSTHSPEKAAGGFNMELTQEVLAKIASFMLATEEGVSHVEGQLAKMAGAEAAAEYLDFLSVQDEELNKLAAFEAGEADAEAAIASMVEGDIETQKSAAFEAGEADAEAALAAVASEARVSKVANAVRAALDSDQYDAGKSEDAGVAEESSTVESDVPVEGTNPEERVTEKTSADEVVDAYYKLGQEIADASLAAAMQNEMPVPEEAMMPAMEGEMGGMDDEPSEEELAMALEQLVAEGVIGEEELAQILEVLEAGGVEEEGAPMDEMVAGDEPAAAETEAGGAEDQLA